jgi:hypothetical protein
MGAGVHSHAGRAPCMSTGNNLIVSSLDVGFELLWPSPFLRLDIICIKSILVEPILREFFEFILKCFLNSFYFNPS